MEKENTKDRLEGALVAPFEPKRINEMLTDTGVINIIYDQTKRMMWSMVEYKDLQMLYTCALKEMQTKFDVLSTEFNTKHKRNPISSIHARIKRTESIMKKLAKLGITPTISNVEKYIHDFAGIRVICSYIDDIYSIADALLKQDDIKLLERKDYIENPKSNGYRSLHLIVSIPVFLADTKKEVKVEVQIRTIAMDFWASLEHQIKYKKEIPEQEEVCRELKECADVIARTDRKMLELRSKIELAEDDSQSEEEELFERMKRLDMPIR